MNNSRVKLIIGLFLAVLVGLVIFSGSDRSASPAQGNSVTATNSDAIEPGVAHPEGLKLYSNAEIGISFYSLSIPRSFAAR